MTFAHLDVTGVDPEVLLAEPRDDAVIDERTVLVQQHPVAGLADGECRHRADVHQIEELRGVGTVDLEFAERRAVVEAGALANDARLAMRRGFDRLTRLRVGRGTPPVAVRLEERAPLGMPGAGGQLPERPVETRGAPPDTRREAVLRVGATGTRRLRT